MNTKQILIAALLAGAFAPAMARSLADSADDNGAPAAHARTVTRERMEFRVGELDDPTGLEHANFGGPLIIMHPKQVKNAPYSAQVVSERTQNLADGNQIVDKSISMSYRDSAGRTRHETRNAAGTITHIAINDVVAGIAYNLNPETKTATQIGPHPAPTRITGEKARLLMEDMRKEGAAARDGVVVKRIERSDGEAGQRVRENVRIQVMRQSHDGRPMPGMETIGPIIAGAFGDMKWSNKASTKDLGTKEIDGVKVQGKLRSYEIPAGEIGNRNAILVANETWYAPELQVTMVSRQSDPRSGERIYRLDSMKREEPAAGLFTVPSDYTVKKPTLVIKKPMEAAQ